MLGKIYFPSLRLKSSNYPDIHSKLMTYFSFPSSIAEMALARAAICAWDNSTRGLDSATALEFVKALRMNSSIAGSCNAVAIYQASQPIYEIFDKVIVLYEGRQIYFGPASHAKDYFLRMGWECPLRQTTGDFLTSVTNPSERQARTGMDAKVPRTSAEFETYWFSSPEFTNLKAEIERHRTIYSSATNIAKGEFQTSKNQQQAKGVSGSSPYLLSVTMQVKLCIKRAYQKVSHQSFVVLLYKLRVPFLILCRQNVERQDIDSCDYERSGNHGFKHWFSFLQVSCLRSNRNTRDIL